MLSGVQIIHSILWAIVIIWITSMTIYTVNRRDL